MLKQGILNIYNLEYVKDGKEARGVQWGHRAREEDVKEDEYVMEGLEPHCNLKGLMIEKLWWWKICTMDNDVN